MISEAVVLEMNPLDSVISKLRSISGVIDVWPVDDAERLAILRMEESTSKTTGFPGISTSNEGAKLVLQREFVVCINHSSNLRHPSKPVLILMADKDIIGQEVWEQNEVDRLQADPNAIFLGRSFVIFRDKLEAVRRKTVRFVFEPQGFPEIEEIQGVCAVVSATLSPATDAYIKRKAVWNTTDSDRGTVLIGFNSSDKQR